LALSLSFFVLCTFNLKSVHLTLKVSTLHRNLHEELVPVVDHLKVKKEVVNIVGAQISFGFISSFEHREGGRGREGGGGEGAWFEDKEAWRLRFAEKKPSTVLCQGQFEPFGVTTYDGSIHLIFSSTRDGAPNCSY
jgi:hypothetical protein